MRVDTFQKVKLFSGGFVELGVLFGLLDAALHNFHIAEQKLGVDGVDIARRINVSVHVYNIVVFKTADNVHNGLNLSDVSEEFVAETLTLRRAFDQTRDVAKFDRGIDCLFGMINFMQLGDACVRYGDDADVRLDRAERIIGCLRARLGDRVEQGTLADIRQTDDT